MARRVKKVGKLWFEMSVQGTAYKVLLGTPAEFECLVDNEGVCIPELAVIIINSDLSATRYGDVFAHELLHAIAFSSGITRQLLEALGISSEDESKRDRIEEALVHALAPVLHDTLVRNGLLRLPKLPR